MRKILSVGVISALLIACSSQTSSKIPTVNSEREVSVEKIEMAPAIETESEEIVNRACPDDMVEINQNYCARDDAKCLYWVTSYGKKTNIETDRCGEFRSPVHCLVPTIHLHYCIDKYEWPNKVGEIPKDWMSYNSAKKEIEASGKRLCTMREWMAAALGPDNRPYPFGDGFHRDHSCNIDQHTHGIDVFKATSPNSPTAIEIRKMLVASGSMSHCVSSTGVYDMSGNLDEIVENESGRPHKSALCSGHFYGVRNKSRGVTLSHNEEFRWYEVGSRSCLSINQ